MGEKYSKEDHDKCKKVAEVFQELYDVLGDTCVLDAGEFGFVYLTYYREQKSCFVILNGSFFFIRSMTAKTTLRAWARTVATAAPAASI